MNNNLYMLLTNEYPSESNQNLVHYLSCQAVRLRRTTYLNFYITEI